MPHYKIERDFIYIDLPKDIAHDQLNAIWNEKRKMWRIPNTIAAIREIFPYFDFKDRLVSVWKQKTHDRQVMLGLKKIEDAEGDERLRPYQRVDVQYSREIPHTGIFNEQRTGKTPTALVLLKERKLKKNLFVVPAGLCLNWKDEFEKWMNDKKVKVMTGLPKQKRQDMYRAWEHWEEMTLIVSYETLVRDMEYFTKLEYDCVLLDEAHRLRSAAKGQRNRSAQCNACFAVGKQAKHRFALTGTPTVKNGEEIFGILHFLYPEKFPGYWQFVERYFNVKKDFLDKTFIDGYRREEELQEIITLISVNRKRHEVMKWLPKKQYQNIRLDLTDKQKKAYDSVEDIFEYEEDGELKVDAQNVLVQLTRLRQLTTDPKMLDIDTVGAKEKFLLEWLENNPGESVVIFSTFTSSLVRLYKVLNKKGYKVGSITGDQSQPVRKINQADFQAGNTQVLLCNIKAAGQGLTLDKGTTCIFLDKEYNPTDNVQAEDRIIPTSEDRNHSTTIISLVCKGTVDEMLEAVLRQKKDITDVVNNAGVKGLRRILQEEGFLQV